MADFDPTSMTDEQLSAIASQGSTPSAASAAPAPTSASFDPSQMTDEELHQVIQQGAPLSSAPDDTFASRQGKLAATELIRGAIGGTVSLVPNLNDMASYLVDRANQAVFGKQFVEQSKAKAAALEAQTQKNPTTFDTIQKYANPLTWLPSQKTAENAIFDTTGAYVPQNKAEQYEAAGLQMVGGLIGGEAGAAKSLGALKNAVVPSLSKAGSYATAAGAGVAGQAATDITGDPLYGMAAGLIVPSVAGKIGSGVAGLAKPYIQPLTSAGRTNAVADLIRRNATNPEAALANIQNAQELVPGAPMTTAEASGDIGLAQSTKAMRTAFPDRMSPQLSAIEDAQNAARANLVENLAPAGANVMSPGQVLATHLSNVDDAENMIISNLQNQADAIHSQMPEGTPVEDTGEAIRKLQQAASDAANETRRRLFDAVDPDKSLNILTPALQKAKSTIEDNENITLKESPLAKSVVDRIGTLPTDVVSFSDLRQILQSMNDKIKTANSGTVEPQSDRLIKILRSALWNDINNAVDNQHKFEMAQKEAGLPLPNGTIQDRLNEASSDIFGAPPPPAAAAPAAPSATPQGSPVNLNNYEISYPHGSIQAKYEVVDHDNLVPSHDANFNMRSDYPQELQSRDRAAGPAQEQVISMANDLHPNELMPSPVSAMGAPIVGPDNVVESGNGRTMAIGRAYDEGKADAYRKRIEDMGFDTTGMKKPVLVARRTTEFTPEQRRIFAESSQPASLGLGMGASEQGVSDAKLMNGMSEPVQPGAINSAANRNFVKEFLGKLSVGDRRNFLDANGNLSPSGVRRLNAALFHRAWGDEDILHKVFESADDNIKNIGGALTDTAAKWGEVRRAAANGEIDPSHDITKPLLDTVKTIMRQRDESARGVNHGASLSDYLNQRDAFNEPVSPEVTRLLVPNGERVASRREMTERLNRYADQALLNKKGETNMFGEGDLPSESVLKASNDASDAQETKINQAFPSGAQEKPTAETAQPAPKAEGPEPEPLPTLSPNMTEEDAVKLKAANAYHAEYIGKFKSGPTGNILKSNGFFNPDGTPQYVMPDSKVAAKVFTSGDTGYETVKKVLSDGNNDPDLIDRMKDIATTRLREMMKGNEHLSPKVLQSWGQKYAGAIRALEEVSPGFTNKFSNMAKATKALGDAQARYINFAKNAQKGAAANLVGAYSPDHVKDIVGGLLKQSDGALQIKNLIAKMKADPSLPGEAGIAGLRRAGAEWMKDNLTNYGKKGGEDIVSGAKLRNFLNSNSDAVRELYGEEGLNNMRRLQADMERTQTAINNASVKGGSDTGQNKYLTAKVVGQGHGSIGAAMTFAGFEALQHFGLRGAAAVAALAGARSVLSSLRAHGISNIQDLYMEALADPKIGAAMLQRGIENNGQLNANAVRNLAKTVKNSGLNAIRLSEQDREKSDDLEQRKRIGRATGGRIAPEAQADRLINAAERAKKQVNKTTEPLLNVPDDHIIRALNVAQAAI